MASKKNASCSNLHLKIIGKRNSISGYLDPVPEIHIPDSEIEIDEYASSPLSYDTIGWWTETHDMIPLMTGSGLPERKRKFVLAEFNQYDRRDLFGPSISEKGIDTLSHIWGKEIEQEAVQEVLNILESTALRCSKPGSGKFDLAYHSPHDFSRIEIQSKQKELLRILFWEFPPRILEQQIKTFRQIEDTLERLIGCTRRNGHKRRELSEQLKYCRKMRKAAVKAKHEQQDGKLR